MHSSGFIAVAHRVFVPPSPLHGGSVSRAQRLFFEPSYFLCTSPWPILFVTARCLEGHGKIHRSTASRHHWCREGLAWHAGDSYLQKVLPAVWPSADAWEPDCHSSLSRHHLTRSSCFQKHCAYSGPLRFTRNAELLVAVWSSGTYQTERTCVTSPQHKPQAPHR